MKRRERARRVTHMLASRMLSYPDSTLLEQHPVLADAADGLPRDIRPALQRFLRHVADTPLPGLEDDYVRTFDLKRRHCLYLTYYSCGDTRRRGAALLEFKRAYADAGLPLDECEQELPDHLAVVLEFSAAGDGEVADRLLHSHRSGIEALHRELANCGSPYADVLHAVRATLPKEP